MVKEYEEVASSAVGCVALQILLRIVYNMVKEYEEVASSAVGCVALHIFLDGLTKRSRSLMACAV